MNKKLLTAAVAAAMVAPAAMAGDVTIYGVAHVAMSYYDMETDGAGHSDKVWDLASHASRIGFKGSEDLGGGLSAIWQMELQIELADAGSTGAGVLNNTDWANMRNSFVGLAGGWGTFLAGRHDTPYKISTGSLDLFSDTIADYNGNGSDAEPGFASTGLGFEDARADSAVAYISPSFNGLTLAAAFVTAGGTDHFAGGGVPPGESVDLSDLFEAWSLAALYSNGPFFASLAYETIDDETVDALNASLATDKWRIGLGYTANGFHVGLVYEDENADDAFNDGIETGDVDRWQLSGSYTFGNNVVKAMYGAEDRKEAGANGDRNQWAIGIDHNFSKRTQAYLVYTSYDSDGAGTDWDGYSLGLKHSF